MKHIIVHSFGRRGRIIGWACVGVIALTVWCVMAHIDDNNTQSLATLTPHFEQVQRGDAMSSDVARVPKDHADMTQLFERSASIIVRTTTSSGNTRCVHAMARSKKEGESSIHFVALLERSDTPSGHKLIDMARWKGCVCRDGACLLQ